MTILRHPAAAPRYDRLFDPVTILTVAGGAISAVGAIQQGRAADRQARAQADVIEQQAAHDRQANAIEVDRLRRANQRTAARARAIRGASGVDISTGSPLLEQANFAAESEFEALLAEANGDVENTRALNQAAFARAQGASARRGSIFAAGSNLIAAGTTGFLLQDRLNRSVGSTGGAGSDRRLNRRLPAVAR